MDLAIRWEGRDYTLDLDSITGKEFEEIEKVTGLLPDEFLTGIIKVEVETDETGEPVLYPVVDDEGNPKVDAAGQPVTAPHVLRVRMPSGGACRALMWLFLKRDRQAVRLSQVDVPYAKFVAAFKEGIEAVVEANGLAGDVEEVEPESPKDSTVNDSSSTPSDTGSASPDLSPGS